MINVESITKLKLSSKKVLNSTESLRPGIVLQDLDVSRIFRPENPRIVCPTSEMFQNPSQLRKLRVEGTLTVRDIVRWWPALKYIQRTYKSLRILTGQLPVLKIDYFRRLVWPGLRSVKIEAYEIDDFEGLLNELLHLQEIEIRVETLGMPFDELFFKINSFFSSKFSSTNVFDCLIKNNRVFLSKGKLKFCNYGIVHLSDPRVFHRYVRSLTY